MSVRRLGENIRKDRVPVVASVVHVESATDVYTAWDGSVSAALVTGMTQTNGDYTRDGASEQNGPVLHSLGWGIDGVTWRPLPLSIPGDSDAQPTTGRIDAAAKMQFWTGAEWRRVRGIGNTGSPAGAAGAINAAAYMFGWNGAVHVPATSKAQDSTGLAVGSYGLQTASQMYAVGSASVAAPLRCDDSQQLIITAADPSLLTAPAGATMYSGGGAIAAAVKAAAGRLFAVHARVSHATAGGAWFQLFNKATAPAAADVPVWQCWVPVNTAADLSVIAGREHFGPAGLVLATGLAYGISTTVNVYTPIGAVVASSVNLSYR